MFSINNNFVDEFERRMLKTMRDELATLGLDNGPTVDSLPMLGGPTGGPVLALTGSKALTNIGGRALAGFGAVDYVEMDDKFHIVGDFPGCKKADVDVKVDGNLLTITAERKWCHREEDAKFRKSERGFGKVSRSWNMPNSAKLDGIEAKFENGQLCLDIPKVTGSTGGSSKKIVIH